MSKSVMRRGRNRRDADPTSPRAERIRAVRKLGGRLGGLRQEWWSRSANGWDAQILTLLHWEVMETSRAVFAASGRECCQHGELSAGPACLPCLFGESAAETARSRAVRDIIRFGGWGQPEPWSQARARVCSVKGFTVPTRQADWVLVA